MVDITEISAIVAAAGVLVGVAYYILDMRHQSKIRQTDITYRLYSHVCTKEFREAMTKFISAEFKDYNDFVEKYGTIYSEKPVPIALGMIGMYCEGIGVLLHRKLVDVDLIRELFVLGRVWEKMKPIVKGTRKQYNMPQYYEWFEYLYNELKKREQKLQQEGVKSG